MSRLVLLAAAAAVLCVGAAAGSARATSNLCPSKNRPNTLVLAGGSGQTAQLGKPFSSPLQVMLANTNGCPLTGNLAGVSVDFDAPGAGPSGIFSSTGSREAVVGTDAQGVATAPTFTANDTVGSYTVDAHSDYGSVNLNMSNTAAGLSAAIAVNGTADQEAAVNTQYAQPLQARVTDANGNPVQGATVSFAVVPGATGAGATFLGQPTATTDSTGLATAPPLLANGTAGRFTATASTDGVSAVVVFTLDNHAVGTTVATADAPRASARVDGSYQPLHAVVLDSTGQPIEGVNVTFSIAPSVAGAGATFADGAAQASATTDENGQVTSPGLVANKTMGSFTVTAATTGETAPLTFTLTNLAGPAHAIAPGAASGQSTTVRTRFPIPFAVTITDKDGNPVRGAVVVFSAPARGAGGHFEKRSHRIRIATDAHGVAVAPAFTANGKAGGYAVTATVQGTSLRTAFALVNEARG